MTHNVEKDGEKYIAVGDKVGNVQKKVLAANCGILWISSDHQGFYWHTNALPLGTWGLGLCCLYAKNYYLCTLSNANRGPWESQRLKYV